MKLVSTLALAASLALGAGLSAAPAIAQEAQAAAPARQYDLSKEGRAALIPLEAAVNAKDSAAYAAALPAAQAAAKTADDRYVIAQLQLRRGIDANDTAMQLAAVEAIAASGGATAEELPKVYRMVAQLHQDMNQPDQAAAALEKLTQLQPNDPDALLRLAELRAKQSRPADAITYIENAIALQKAAGQTPPENWYRRALKFAYEGKLPRQSAELSRTLLQAYPSPENWQSALAIFRGGAKLDAEGELDLLRLMRATRSPMSQGEYLALAARLDEGNYYGELQNVAREAAAAGKGGNADLVAAAKSASAKVAEDKAALAGLVGKARADASGATALRIANGFFGHGDYAQAAELYRLAAEKGSADADLAKLRLGIALAMQGKKAEADAALKSVGGARAGLAGLWSLYVSQRA